MEARPAPLHWSGLHSKFSPHCSATIYHTLGIPAIYLAAQQMWSPVRGNPRQAAKPVKPVRQSPSESFLSVAGGRATDQHLEVEVFFLFNKAKQTKTLFVLGIVETKGGIDSWQDAFADPAFPGLFDTGSKNKKTGKQNNKNEVA